MATTKEKKRTGKSGRGRRGEDKQLSTRTQKQIYSISEHARGVAAVKKEYEKMGDG